DVLSCLKPLLEGVSRAVIKYEPEDVAEFVAFYFQELIDFPKENSNLELTEVIEKFDLEHETLDDPQRREACTDAGEDDLEDIATKYSSKMTQYPSKISVTAVSGPTGPDGASSLERAELVYVPADPALLAAHVLGNSNSVYFVWDVATTVQSLWEAEASRSQLEVQCCSSVTGQLARSGSQADVATNGINQVCSAPLQEEPSPLPPP
ncbi:CABYR protein, partial [Alectura lathami]|nr:CABYR protein [Alectura lathami]